MKKIYKKLTPEQIARGVIFSSCLSVYREEMEGDTIHEVKTSDEPTEASIKIVRLKNDKFFNSSHWKFNIIREGAPKPSDMSSIQSKHDEADAIASAPTMAEQIAAKDAKETEEALSSLRYKLEEAQACLSLAPTAPEAELKENEEEARESAEKRRDEWEEQILSVDKELIRCVVLCTGGPQIEIQARYIRKEQPCAHYPNPPYNELVGAKIVYIGWFDSPHEEIEINENKYPDLWAYLEMLGENEG